MKVKPKTHFVQDIWESYAFELLRNNPEWWGVPKAHNSVKNYFLYRKYVDEKGKLTVIEVFNYKKFREVIELYFTLAKTAVINGAALDITSGVGRIAARRVERDHSKRSINFFKTKQQPKVWSDKLNREVRARIIYYTSDDWCRIGWHKFGRLKNESGYEFAITKSNKAYCKQLSFGQQFDKALKENPLLKFKYVFYPLKSKTKNTVS